MDTFEKSLNFNSTKYSFLVKRYCKIIIISRKNVRLKNKFFSFFRSTTYSRSIYQVCYEAMNENNINNINKSD